MLKIINPECFFEGSFADNRITGAVTDVKNRYLKFCIDGAQTEDEQENPVNYDLIELEISGWSKHLNYELVQETGNLKNIPPEDIDVFDDIILFILDNESLILKGFGRKSGAWYEYHFTNPKIVIKGELISP